MSTQTVTKPQTHPSVSHGAHTRVNVPTISIMSVNTKVPVFVLDTSALSHAFESLAPALVWAYASQKRKLWFSTVEGFKRREASAFFMREFLLGCGTKYECVVPKGVLEELLRTPYFRREVTLFFISPYAIENEFKRMFPGNGKNITGFGYAFVPRIMVVDWVPSKDIHKRIKDIEHSMGKLPGKELNDVDVTGIALAKELGAQLITGDKRQYLVARQYGARVRYTLR